MNRAIKSAGRGERVEVIEMVFLSLLAVVVIVLRWVLVLVGTLDISDPIPGHRNWSLSFVGPDVWLAVSCLLTAVCLVAGSRLSIAFALIAGASCVVHALFVFSYLAVTRRALPRMDRTILGVMGLYLVAFGAALLVSFWKTIG
jgi:hypothetical protein